MEAFSSYVSHLDGLVSQAIRQGNDFVRSAQVHAALDAEPSVQLRRLIPQETLRAAGAFFTSSTLADRALSPFLSKISTNSVILDPACGAGDLLLKCAAHFTSAKKIDQSIDDWGAQLLGRDLQSEFIRAARARLMLQALASTQTLALRSASLESIFPGLEARCGLTDVSAFASATHIVLNPPFSQTAAPTDCAWAKGKVSSAALFLATCLQHSKPGTKILAILPDSLRSGTRYHKWRALVETLSLVKRIEPYGQFDEQTDIDVFILELEVKLTPSPSPPASWFPVNSDKAPTVGDLFDVTVGPVVDYRDAHSGPNAPFLCARDLPSWQTLRGISRTRRFLGRKITSPFVVVRRTSRPGDKYRAIGTIISIPKPAAVENHLIVLSPKSGTTKQCLSLLKLLKQDATSQWLDQRIRCRHLTVSALANLPWRSNEK